MVVLSTAILGSTVAGDGRTWRLILEMLTAEEASTADISEDLRKHLRWLAGPRTSGTHLGLAQRVHKKQPRFSRALGMLNTLLNSFLSVARETKF